MSIDLMVDAHVHSNFSDGRDHPATNVAIALGRGLKMIGLVDHVRADTGYLWG
jgi:predicted metal-dependent phosphoesterase TrpH